MPGARPELDDAIGQSLARGVAVALATVVAGPGSGEQMLVWAAGQTRGGLGAPRLNQRAALHAEQLFERGTGTSRQAFTIQGETIEVEFQLFLP
ncbi:MAG: XdhC family protein [Acidobacteriota bacterium]